MLNLTQKETTLLQDLKNYEQLCVQKYNRYANQAQDPQLKQLFQNLAQHEQKHLDTINQIVSGQLPNLNQQQGQQNTPTFTQGTSNPNDAYLCQDLLATEKHASSAYDTVIFEFSDSNVRQALNHIQKEEQEHGDYIFKYMQAKGIYNPQ